METVILALSSGTVGALAAVVISIIYQRKAENRRYSDEKRRWKLDTLQRLAAHRYVITRGTQEAKDTFFATLNEVFVVFHDAPEVLETLQTMKRELGNPGSFNDNIVTLFKRMCADLDIKHPTLNESFFLEPFTPGKDY